MSSIIAAIELLQTILKSVGICETRVPLYTDSETSIISSKNKKLNTLHFVISNDVDVAIQLQKTVNENSNIITLFHVQGHQDKNKKFEELDVPAQLNVLMDGLSKEMVTKTKGLPNKIIPFPAQRLYLKTDGALAHNIVNTLITREMRNDVEEYYEKHHNIPRELLLKVDWEANRIALSNKNELSYRKTFHNLRNTMTVNKKWKRIESDACPLCSKAPETIPHLLSCSQPDMLHMRNTIITKMESTWKKLNTHKGIVSHWKMVLSHVQSGLSITTPGLSMNPTSWSIIQAHQQQTAIGWTSFTNGILSKKWAEIQQRHYDDNPADGENIFRWKRTIIQSFMNLLQELWKLRCGFIHAETTHTARDILCRRTLQTFLNSRHHKDMLPVIDRHLLEKEESYFWKSSRETLEIWEDRMKKALTNINIRENDQPCIHFPVDRQQLLLQAERRESSFEHSIQRLNNFIANAKRMRQKRPLTNLDPVWNKRLRTTHNRMMTLKRSGNRHQNKTRRVRRKKEDISDLLLIQLHVVLPQCAF